MKKTIVSVGLVILLLMSTTSFVVAKNLDLNAGIRLARSEIATTVYSNSSDFNKKSIDGSTAASKLRAKKSHSVSKQDETKLTVFLGILAMAFIVFFIKIVVNSK